MKILQINVTYQYGSTGKIVDSIHQHLLSSSHESHVLYGRHKNLNDENIHYMGNKVSHFLHGIKTRIFDRHGFGSLYATKKALKKLDIKSFDIIHLHNIHGYYIHIGYLMKILKKYDKKVIWTLHDAWPYTGHCFGYQSVSCTKWQTSCNNCPLKHSYPSSIFLDQSRKNQRDKKNLISGLNHLTLVPSSYYLSYEIKKSFLSSFKSFPIHNGINLDDFKKPDNYIEKNQILGVANIWNETKGIEVFNRLAETLNDSFQITVVGLLPKGYYLHPRINHINQTKDKKTLIELYQSSLCLINPTIEDNFPTVSIESIACGTPVITYDTGGSNEIIDETCGFICPPNDFSCLISKILELKRLGKSSFIDASLKKSKAFDENIMGQGYLDLYLKVTNS